MRSYSSYQAKPLKAPLPSFPQKSKENKPTQDPRYINTALSGANQSRLKRSKLSISSQSSFSRDTQSASEKHLSSDDSSLNDISRFNPTPSRLSQESYNYSSKSSINSRQAQKVDLMRGIDDALGSLRDISNIEEPSQKLQLPNITAKCWGIMDAKSGELLYAKKDNRRREIASLTKMMNFLCVNKLMKQFKIDPKDTYIQVSKNAASMRGTSARLKAGDILTIYDLLHGLMLPSGNDAAVALAENFGTYIYLHSDEYKDKLERNPNASQEVKNPMRYFLKLMNQMAKELGLVNTSYSNPHGLVDPNNFSTVADQAKLSFYLMKSDLVREIVNKSDYSCEIEESSHKMRITQWENTNKLLGKVGWCGLKTGITTAAGPCLSAYYENEEEAYIVILLNSETKDIRWTEAPRLVNWIRKNRDSV